MTVTMTTTEDRGEAAPGGPQPTHIDVHIYQESALAKLLQIADAHLQAPKLVTTSCGARLLVASWAMQITLGLLCGVLGGLLFLCPSSYLRDSGAAFWTGGVAVLAGAVAFIYEKRRGIFWAFLKTVLLLAVFSTAVTAIVIAANTFYSIYYFYDENDNCDISSPRTWPTYTSSAPDPENIQRLALCFSYVRMLKAMAVGLHAILLALWILLIFTSLTPSCLFFWKKCLAKEKTDQKKLLAGNEN
ncbi:transmembrane protein 176A [Suncus etruscus]|uniref:transmembrane protein 176A n=1 Tax=Suncus etruscus TaxID=109475 RepID=UPI0021102419|nr:transmembrane protein 176A [Suncus etruscus]